MMITLNASVLEKIEFWAIIYIQFSSQVNIATKTFGKIIFKFSFEP